MMLPDAQKFVKAHQVDIILAIGVFLLSLFSFGAGYLAAREQLKEPIEIQGSSFEVQEKNSSEGSALERK